MLSAVTSGCSAEKQLNQFNPAEDKSCRPVPLDPRRFGDKAVALSVKMFSHGAVLQKAHFASAKLAGAKRTRCQNSGIRLQVTDPRVQCVTPPLFPVHPRANSDTPLHVTCQSNNNKATEG